MEEKNATKISLSTFFLIISLIIIAVMGYFIFKLYNDKQLQYKDIDSLNSKISSLTNTNQDLQNKLSITAEVTNNNSNIQNNRENKVSSLNNDISLKDEELFYCENVNENKDGTYTFKGIIYEPYKISTNDFKEMLKQDKIILKENNLSNRLKNNECIIRQLNDNEFMPYELLSSENSEHFCYIKGNDKEGYQLDLGTEYSTIWKKTDDNRELTFSKDTYYLDIESLGYANYMSKDELEEKIYTLFDDDEDKFKNLVGSYLKFNNSIYKVTEGITSFH